jgi:hypothetical protein
MLENKNGERIIVCHYHYRLDFHAKFTKIFQKKSNPNSQTNHHYHIST